jgi:ribosomal protein L37E
MADENRPTSDEFECEECGERIYESEAEECETCGRGCCTLCSAESICPECQE